MHNHSEKFEPKKAIIVTIVFILFLIFGSMVARNRKTVPDILNNPDSTLNQLETQP